MPLKLTMMVGGNEDSLGEKSIYMKTKKSELPDNQF